MVNYDRVIGSGGRVYYSQIARALVDTTGMPDPVAAVEHLSSQLLREADVASPPIALEMLASFQGVTAIKLVDMPGSGRIVPRGGGSLEVHLRIGDSPGRRNFSLGHEIGHTLMPGYRAHPEEKHDLYTGEFAEKNEEEYFCDIAARSLLLPEELFRSVCTGMSPSINGLLMLAEQFQCSLEAVALRIDQSRVWPCIPIVWELQLKPTQVKTKNDLALPGFEELSIPQEEYRVKFHAGRGAHVFFPAFKHIGKDCPMVLGCMQETSFKGKCLLPASKKDVECYAEAVAVPYRDRILSSD